MDTFPEDLRGPAERGAWLHTWSGKTPDVCMELLLAADDAHLGALAAKHGWCTADKLDAQFYAYLDAGAFRGEAFDRLLWSAQPQWMERTDDPFTFFSRETNRTIGPGKLPAVTRWTMTLIANSQRGIRTEVFPEMFRCWEQIRLFLPNPDFILLTAATEQTAARLWGNAEATVDASLIREAVLLVYHNGSCHLLALDELRALVERAHRPPLLAENPAPLANDLTARLRRCRSLITRPSHALLPRCAPVRAMQAAGWTVLNDMCRLPDADTPFIFEDADRDPPTIYLVSRSGNGRWRVRETGGQSPSYAQLLAAAFTEVQGSKAQTWVLAMNHGLPCYGFAANGRDKIIELTDSAAALTMFRAALQGYAAHLGIPLP